MNLRASLDDAKTASALPLGRPFLTATKSAGPYSSHSQPVHLDDDLHRVSGLGEPVFHLTLAGTERQPIEFHNIAPRPESHVQSPMARARTNLPPRWSLSRPLSPPPLPPEPPAPNWRRARSMSLELVSNTSMYLEMQQ